MQEFLLVGAVRQRVQTYATHVHRHFPALCDQEPLVHHTELFHKRRSLLTLLENRLAFFKEGQHTLLLFVRVTGSFAAVHVYGRYQNGEE